MEFDNFTWGLEIINIKDPGILTDSILTSGGCFQEWWTDTKCRERNLISFVWITFTIHILCNYIYRLTCGMVYKMLEFFNEAIVLTYVLGKLILTNNSFGWTLSRGFNAIAVHFLSLIFMVHAWPISSYPLELKCCPSFPSDFSICGESSTFSHTTCHLQRDCNFWSSTISIRSIFQAKNFIYIFFRSIQVNFIWSNLIRN